MYVAIGKFTKWPEAYPVVKIDKHSALKFIRGITSRFGVPNRIIIDNGTQFTSELSPAVAPPPPLPAALPLAPPRLDRFLLAPTAEITARMLSRSRLQQRGRIPSGISVGSAESRPSTRRITLFASSSPQSQRSPTCVRMGSLGPVYSHAPRDHSWRGAMRRRK